jgi:hypothetical protein
VRERAAVGYMNKTELQVVEIFFLEYLNLNSLHGECTLAVHNVVRDFAGLVTGAAPPFLVNIFDQLPPVSGETSHPFGIADFSSICLKVTF